ISLTQTVTTTEDGAITTNEDTSITVDVLSNDSDSDGGTLSISEIQGQDVSSGQTVNVTLGGAVVGTAQVVAGKIVFTPDENSSLDDGESQDVSFAYTISDGQGGSDTANVTINVTGVTDNSGPVAVDDTSSTQTVTLTETGTTIDNLGGGTSETNTQTLDFGSEHAGKTVTLTFDADVTGGWESSGSAADSFTISANGSTLETHTYYIGDSNSSDVISNTYSYDVVLDSNGQAVVSFNVDSTGSDEVVDVSNISASITTTTSTLTTDEDSAITVDVLSNDSDADNDSLSITQVQGQDVSSGQTVNVTNSLGIVIGTAAVVDGKIVFTPGDELDSLDAGESEDVTFAYTISDGQGGTDSANVSLTVTGLSNDSLGTTITSSGDVNNETLNNVDGFGDNIDTLNVSDDIQGTSSISMYDGDDTINVSDDIDDTVQIDMGSGNDTLNVGDDIRGTTNIDMGTGDDTVHMQDTEGETAEFKENATIDFGEGLDTLIIEDDFDLNFDNLTLDGSSYNQLSNLEVIDMQNGTGDNDLTNLDLSDVLHMTDDDNILKILGDSGDSIGLNTEGSDAEWVKSDTQVSEDGEEFDVWTNSDNNATLYIDDDITITDF
ncbi:MAG: cadherin-like domain-containing protein, partial [Campylobacteraceae bacterium]|nr:cadherin-like domain-containing protein [Campylobacteraceae bacterium]